MLKKQYSNEERAVQLRDFRSLMNIKTSREDVERIWKLNNYSKYPSNIDINQNIEKKVSIAKRNVQNLKLFNLVKFIGVSGSVGAGFAKEVDDIDVFIVVRNGSVWLYRLCLEIRNIFSKKIRTKRDRCVKDKFCLNLICEERGLLFESDIFNFHELMFVKPIYNPDYLNYIYSENDWLYTEWGVRRRGNADIVKSNECNIFIRLINEIAFFLQCFFMLISKHNPDIERIRRNKRLGRIEFFPKNFRKRKIDRYNDVFDAS